MLSDKQRALAAKLIDIGAVKFGNFRLKMHEKNPSAPLSPIYIDLRLLRSFPEAFKAAIDAYSEMAGSLVFDCFADVPTAGTPLAAALAFVNRRPMISPRLDQKTHGTASKIDGAFKAGQIALVIDDLITDASSKLQAVQVLEQNGIHVRDVIVLIDREQGGLAELASRGYVGHAALKLSELLKFYLAEGRISQADYDRTLTYLGVPPSINS